LAAEGLSPSAGAGLGVWSWEQERGVGTRDAAESCDKQTVHPTGRTGGGEGGEKALLGLSRTQPLRLTGKSRDPSETAAGGEAREAAVCFPAFPAAFPGSQREEGAAADRSG